MAERCCPVEMAKNLRIVNRFEKDGIDFVAIPVLSESDKFELIEELLSRIDLLYVESNKSVN